MAPADIQVVLDAIDGLRREMRSMFEGHDERIRALETRAAAREAVSSDRAERRATVTMSRRWIAGLLFTVAAAGLSGFLNLVSILGPHR